jgi:type III restriction enzyme
VGFTLGYVTADESRSNYVSDFIVNLTNGEVWIVETKGREDENDPGSGTGFSSIVLMPASWMQVGSTRGLPVREEEWDTYPYFEEIYAYDNAVAVVLTRSQHRRYSRYAASGSCCS